MCIHFTLLQKKIKQFRIGPQTHFMSFNKIIFAQPSFKIIAEISKGFIPWFLSGFCVCISSKRIIIGECYGHVFLWHCIFMKKLMNFLAKEQLSSAAHPDRNMTCITLL